MNVYINGYDAEGITRYFIEISKIIKYLESKPSKMVLLLTSNRLDTSKAVERCLSKMSKIEIVYLKKFFKNPGIILRALFSSGNYILNFKSLSTTFSIDGTMIGDAIYDTILRNDKDIQTVNKLKPYHFRYIMVAMLEYYSYLRIIKLIDLDILFTNHMVYSRFSILSRIASHKKRVVFYVKNRITLIEGDSYSIYNFNPSSNFDILSNFVNDKLVNNAEAFISRRLKGQTNIEAVKKAYTDKALVSKIDLDKRMNLVNNEKTKVLIAAHVFSDAPHKIKNNMFKDFFEWFAFTINEASNNKDAIFIIKEHPSSSSYDEIKVIESSFAHLIHSNDNLIILDNSISTRSLIEYVDVVLTHAGTIALEYATLGVPSVITAKTFYSNSGFTIEPKNKFEYKHVIKNISKIRALNEYQILAAKLLMYKYEYTIENYLDEFDRDIISDNSKSHIEKIEKYTSRTSSKPLENDLINYFESILSHYFD